MVSRLFQIVYKLIDSPQMTAKELAAEVGVSERTIYRDVEKLSLAGIPIYANQGKNGGIALLPDFVLDKTVLSENEKQRILESLNALNNLPNLSGNDDIEKIKSFFGESSNLYDWIEVEFSTWGNREKNEELFNRLKSAILNRRFLQIEYSAYNSNISNRKVKPLKLCFKNEAWYLYAFCMTKNDYRFFKLSRIRDFFELDEFFDIEFVGKVLPKMSEQYQSSLATSNSENKVILEIDSKMAYRALDELEVLERYDDGSLRCVAKIPDTSWMINYLLSYGASLKVIEPESVKNLLKAEIQKMLENKVTDFSK